MQRVIRVGHTDTMWSPLRTILWASDQPVAETSTSQLTKLTRHRHPCYGGIRTSNPSMPAAADPRLRPRGHWDRPQTSLAFVNYAKVSTSLWRYAKLHHTDTQEKKEPTDDTSKDVYSLYINSTYFGHHYAHRQETDWIEPRVVLVWMCWLR